MTKIDELFAEAVSTPPPSRLTADEVLAAAGAAGRRRTTILAAAGVTVVLAGVAALALVHPAPVAPVGDGTQHLLWAGRADATHFYAVRDVCGLVPTTAAPASVAPSTAFDPSAAPPQAPRPDRLCNELLASADAGTTWVGRGLMAAGAVTILGPLRLLRVSTMSIVGPATPPNGFQPIELSSDGGVTWSSLPDDGPDIGAVPADGAVGVSVGTGGVAAFDPVQGRFRALAHQPDLVPSSEPVTSRDLNGTLLIWVAGTDRATGRPAVSVSHDRGAIWTTRPLPATAAHGGSASPPYLQVIAGSSGTSYAVLADPSTPPPTISVPGTEGEAWFRGFRTADGGANWEEMGPGPVVPSFGRAWLTTDGRLVLTLHDHGGGRTPLLVSSDGRRFTPANPPGLPATVSMVDGVTAFDEQAMYVSDDGWTWREVWRA